MRYKLLKRKALVIESEAGAVGIIDSENKVAYVTNPSSLINKDRRNLIKEGEKLIQYMSLIDQLRNLGMTIRYIKAESKRVRKCYGIL